MRRDVVVIPLPEAAMGRSARGVLEAISRWEQKALIQDDLAATLRKEVDETSAEGTARLAQYVLAATAAVVLLIAAGVFVDWAWPRMDDRARTVFLVAVGIGVHLWGARIEAARRWLPAALLMQVSGLGVLAFAIIYSERAWADGTAGAIILGVLGLLAPVVLAPRTLRGSTLMPAVHLCFALEFLALFLDRATPVSGNDIIWIIDGVLVAAIVLLVALMRRDQEGKLHPWALNAFAAALYAGFVLVVLTGDQPLDLQEDVAYALDVWLLLVVGVTLWGIHRAPSGLRRDWFEDQLALAMLAWIPLAFFTALEAMESGPEVPLALIGVPAVAGFAYADRYRVRGVLATSALSFVVAVWYWGVERAGALGAAIALGVTAGLLFWLSGRIGRGSDRGNRVPGVGGSASPE
jgi:uncharacterized membrane protein